MKDSHNCKWSILLFPGYKPLFHLELPSLTFRIQLSIGICNLKINFSFTACWEVGDYSWYTGNCNTIEVHKDPLPDYVSSFKFLFKRTASCLTQKRHAICIRCINFHVSPTEKTLSFLGSIKLMLRIKMLYVFWAILMGRISLRGPYLTIDALCFISSIK